jgi:hypothetical protein
MTRIRRRSAAAMASIGCAGAALARAVHTEKSALSAATREGLIQEAVPGAQKQFVTLGGQHAKVTSANRGIRKKTWALNFGYGSGVAVDAV